MVKEARQMVKSGKFGKIRKVYVEYPQGWLSGPLEKTGNMQASWRTDPKQSGMGEPLVTSERMLLILLSTLQAQTSQRFVRC